MSDDSQSKAGGEAAQQAQAKADYEALDTIAPLDFAGLVVSFGTSALINLGKMPNPETGDVHVDLVAARHTIDMLGLLEEKTRGNLEVEEERMLRDLLFDLRVSYIRAA